MKVQVRKNAITFLYEVQTCEDKGVMWTTQKTFKTKDEADAYAKRLQEKSKEKEESKKKSKK